MALPFPYRSTYCGIHFKEKFNIATIKDTSQKAEIINITMCILRK